MGWAGLGSYDDVISAIDDFFANRIQVVYNRSVWIVRGTKLKNKPHLVTFFLVYLGQLMNFSADPHTCYSTYLHIWNIISQLSSYL